MGKGFADNPVVVVGFGAAAVGAICSLRECGYDRPLTVVTDAGPEPYSPVLTSYYAGGRIGKEQCFPWKDVDFSSLIDDLLYQQMLVFVDFAAHEVELVGGRRVGYSKLLIATGAHPVAPGFPNLETYRPHVLRTMEDADRLREALACKPHARVLVSGTSMVGLKVVEACLDRKVDVTMLGRSPHILRSSAHPVVAERFEQLLEDRGVTFRLSQTVEQVEDASSANRRGVRFSNGDVEEFDEIVLAQGVKPNLEFIDSSSVEMGDGLIVDEFMHTSAPDVFAAGDVAQALDLLNGEKRIIGLWQNAVQQGRCAGAAIAAELAGRAPMRWYPGSIPSNTIHVQDVLFASAGSIAESEGRIIEMSASSQSTSVFAYERNGSKDQLVGFNILAVVSPDFKNESLADDIGTYRRAILNSYL